MDKKLPAVFVNRFYFRIIHIEDLIDLCWWATNTTRTDFVWHIYCTYNAAHMHPVELWLTYGAQTPELVVVENKYLSQPICTCVQICKIWEDELDQIVKRNWIRCNMQFFEKKTMKCEARDKVVFIIKICCLDQHSSIQRRAPHVLWRWPRQLKSRKS